MPRTPQAEAFAVELWNKLPHQNAPVASRLREETKKALDIRKKNETYEMVGWEADDLASKKKATDEEKTSEKKRKNLRKKYDAFDFLISVASTDQSSSCRSAAQEEEEEVKIVKKPKAEDESEDEEEKEKRYAAERKEVEVCTGASDLMHLISIS